ncbi:MAG: ABC transporter ATP-binding protein/permease [Eubacterium sp.]|nr:ABC transporter ATP-binding protein/permease [Eubacterium sp.]
MKNKTKYSVFDNSKYMLSEIHRIDRQTIPLMMLYALPAVVAPLMSTVLLKMLLNILEADGELNRIFISVGIFVILSAIANIARDFIETRLALKRDKIRYEFQSKILLHSMNIPYENIESRQKRKMLEKAQRMTGYINRGISAAVYQYKKLFFDFIGVFSACAIFLYVNFKISLLLLIVGLCTFYIFSHLADNEKEYNDETIPVYQKVNYFTLNKPTEIKAAKDIRIFNISSWFSPMLDILIGDRADIGKVFFKSFTKYRLLEMVLILIREGATMYFLISGVLKNKISVSDFAFYFGILNAFSIWIKGIALDFQDIKKNCLMCSDLREFMALEEMDDTKPPVPIDKDKACEVEFKNVSFSYNKELPVIKNISFKVSSGEKLAIVGENGAGKTTCMKLLSGLYKPDDGEILINGISTSDMPVSQYFSLFSAVFQDAFSLPASIYENVSLSCNTDEDRVTAALKKAGLYDKICTLENGADTMLDKELNKGGIDLSGGELQKLFLARALYKDAPIIILDEPTAALDPIAENDLYIKFNDLTKDKTAFYISHRLSSTRFCDRILYLKDGQIAESGTHEELIARRGDYFRMYEMQSYYYREEKDYDF